MLRTSVASALADPETTAGVGHAVTENPKEDGDQCVDLLLIAEPVRVGGDGYGDANQVEQPNQGDESRIFEQADELPDAHSHPCAQGLGKVDAYCRLEDAETEGLGISVLAAQD